MRLATATALLAALALLALPALGGAATGAGASRECIPVQHKKTVVKRKKVRRNGRWVRVKRKRVKRWWSCQPPPPGCAERAASVGVTAYDVTGTRFVLSRPCVSTGQVNVELRNRGEDPHNLFIRPAGGTAPVYSIPEDEPFELEPLGVENRALGLARGDWYLWCSLLTHQQDGMNAVLQVR